MESIVRSHHGHFHPTTEREARKDDVGGILRQALTRLKTMLTPVTEEDRYLTNAADHSDLEHRMRDVLRQEWKNTYLRW